VLALVIIAHGLAGLAAGDPNSGWCQGRPPIPAGTQGEPHAHVTLTTGGLGGLGMTANAPSPALWDVSQPKSPTCQLRASLRPNEPAAYYAPRPRRVVPRRASHWDQTLTLDLICTSPAAPTIHVCNSAVAVVSCRARCHPPSLLT